MNTQVKDETFTTVEEPGLAERRELIPVGRAGIQITDLAQQVDYAQHMAKAKVALPSHLRGNVGDCLAVIDISQRAGLSPYMVASHCYVQNDKLCFESQLFHAFAQSSGLLYGDLTVEYEGEGDDRICIVTGWLKSHPNTPRVHKSPPLKDLHPGYVLKKAYGDGETGKRHLTYAQGQQLIAEGKIEEGMKFFAQGSPLWIRKPDVQMFYDTSRDWVRIYCPRAVLGIYTQDELMEYGPEFARDVSPPTSGLSERLKGGNVSRDEGHKAGPEAAEALKEAANGNAAAEEPQDGGITPETLLSGVGFKAGTVKALEREGHECLGNILMLSEADLEAIKGCGPAMRKDIKETVEKLGFKLAQVVTPAEQQSGEAAPPAAQEVVEQPKPKNPAEWETYARAWINKLTSVAAGRARWKEEMALRNNCGVVSDQRDPVKAMLDAKCEQLGEDLGE